MKKLFLALFLFSVLIQSSLAENVQLQVLGSGGPELDDGRASTSYLIWVDGKARILIDCGPGTARNFEEAGARVTDLEAILLSHLHVDHTSDLSAYFKGAFFTERTQNLPVFGPGESENFPSTEDFVSALFGEKNSAYPYLSNYLTGGASFLLKPRSLREEWSGETEGHIDIAAMPVSHGLVPALAWKVTVGDRSIVFSGDLNGESGNLSKLAQDCDLLVIHNAIPESATGLARKLHAPPSVIGQMAAASHAKKLILSHRMKRTLGQEADTLKQIRKTYNGPVEFAEDLSVFRL